MESIIVLQYKFLVHFQPQILRRTRKIAEKESKRDLRYRVVYPGGSTKWFH